MEMLRDGLRRAAHERGMSTRAAAKELGYSATVVISHMATGRVPIPLDRAVEIAGVVGLDKSTFYSAVLEQRHPGSAEILGLGAPPNGSDAFFAELNLIAGCELAELPDEHKTVIREVVSERHPRRRWLSFPGLSVMEALRRHRPRLEEEGLSAAELERIADVLG